MVKPIVRMGLEEGAVSAADRRRGFLIVLLVAVIWRLVPLLRVVRNSDQAMGHLAEAGYLGPFLGAHFDLSAFFTNPALAWVGSPLYLLLTSIETTVGSSGAMLLLVQAVASIVVALLIYRFTLDRLGLLAALVAALLWATGRTAVGGGLVFLPELLLALASLVYADRLLRQARRRELGGCLSLGLVAGIVSILSGMGALWIPLTLAWLPSQSRAFRGSGWLRMAGLYLGGFLIVLLPVLLHGFVFQRDFIPPSANAGYDFYQGTMHPGPVQGDSDDQMVYPVGRWARARYQLDQEHGLVIDSSWGRSATYTSMGLSRVGQSFGAYLRRWATFFGGTAAGPALTGEEPVPGAYRLLPLTPIGLALVLSWLGGFALLASCRVYAPLYMGLSIPLVVAIFTGVTGRGQLAALPFICIFAGYGVARAWSSRRWPLSWAVVPAILGLGAWLVVAF